MGVVIVYFHHTNKSTGSASGSNMALRLVDTHIILKKLHPDMQFDLQGKSFNVPCILINVETLVAHNQTIHLNVQ